MPLFVDAKSYDFYVDESAKSGGDGSQEDPFKSVSSAVKKAMSKGGSLEIYVYKGDYDGGFTIGKSIKLVGEDQNKVVISGTVSMENNSAMERLSIKGGYVAISVLKGAEVKIDNCTISGFQKIGVDIVAGKGKLILQNSKIKNSAGKAVYVQRGNRIKLIGNEIYENDEEGFDLRDDISGIISGNYIHDNGESGIEVIVGDADLMISDNNIKNNKASAIAAQFYDIAKDKGDIEIKDNKLTGSSNYALACKNTQGGSIPKDYWKESIKMEGNVLSDNKRDISSICGMGDDTMLEEKSKEVEALEAEIMAEEKAEAEKEGSEEEQERLIQIALEEEEKKKNQEERQTEVKLILEQNIKELETVKNELEKINQEGRLKIFFIGRNAKSVNIAKTGLTEQEMELRRAMETLGEDYKEMSEGETLKTKASEKLSWVSEQKNALFLKEECFSLFGWVKGILHL
jgi:parallel beta-helix repeat protein